MNEVTAEMIERGAGTDALARRRRRDAQRLRDVRARLATGSALPEGWDGELLRGYARARRGSALASAGMVAAVAAASLPWTPWPIVALWSSITLLALAALALLCRNWLAEGAGDDAVSDRRWRMRFVLGEAFHGLCWAGLTLVLLDHGAHDFRMLALLAAAGVSALTAAPLPRAVAAGLAPMLGAVALSLVAAPDLAAATMCGFTFLAQVYFGVLSRRLYANAIAGMTSQLEREGLIAELEQAKANSDEARRRSEEANLAKSRFLATMSHELRTPLNAVLGFSEVMKEELFGPHAVPAYRDYAADIHSSGKHLLDLINEILDLSRIEAGRYELKEEAVNLGFIAEECEHLLSIRARAKSISLALSVAPDLPRVWADERAMRQITLNLLSNAIKFTPNGGAVAIKVGWTASGGQYLAVKDTGPGIPEDEMPTVMSSFGRGEVALKQAEEGSGLGLPIVKGLVELHGGVFVLKSKVREGTEAVMVLPPQRVMAPLAPLDKFMPDQARRAINPAQSRAR
jgi:two-component system cell cycle sensor histidine kinase PleC